MSLTPDQETDIAFALMVSDSYQELQSTSDKAQELYQPSAVEAPGSIADMLNVRVSPNPMVGAGRFAFTVPESGEVSIRLYDLQGRLVQTLFDGTAEAGDYEITLETAEIPEGVYVYHVRAGRYAEQGKMVKTGE